MTKSRHILPPKRFWTEAERELLRQHYATMRSADLAALLDRPLGSVHQHAGKLGLRKSIELIAQMARERTQRPGHGSVRTRIQPGSTPWNKGTKGLAGTQEACRATQFKAGQRPHTWVPVGTFRVVEGDILEQKFADEPGPPKMRWKAYTRIVWERANGPVPDGHLVAFKPGRKTTDPDLVTLDALELVSRVELMARNTFHNLPKPLAQLVQLRGVLNRQINRKAKEAETP